MDLYPGGGSLEMFPGFILKLQIAAETSFLNAM
jgi:hypothetical protein